jgi:DNA-binding HxlR family transcriptional regulator
VTQRSYGQFCAAAKALDVIGERWTLLVVRELLLGPRRFTDLLAALPGLGTSLLASRLKQLEAAGVIRREQLPPPAGSRVYQITDTGLGVGLVVKALADWGARLLDTPGPEDAVRAEWLALHLAVSAPSEAVAGAPETYQVHVDDDVLHTIAACGTPAEVAALREAEVTRICIRSSSVTLVRSCPAADCPSARRPPTPR